MQPVQDHLTFYRVGSAAADAKQASVVPTGAAEDLGMKNSNTSRSVTGVAQPQNQRATNAASRDIFLT
jgi:hypothetical protein